MNDLFLVFDLDKTLWNFYTNFLSDKEFEEKKKNYQFNNEIKKIFNFLKGNNLRFGFASRSKYKMRCSELLLKININLNDYPHFIEWTDSKTKLVHLLKISEIYKINLDDMILIDDDIHNLYSVKDKIFDTILVNKKTGILFKEIYNIFVKNNMDKKLLKCINEYLAFQHLFSNISWKNGCYNRNYNEFIECPRKYLVSNYEEAIHYLEKVAGEWCMNYDSKEIGILISSGIDSASVAKVIPENSQAFYATYDERKEDPEIDKVREYCKINKLNLNIVNVSWNDYEMNIDYLMSVKKNPIHPCEIPVYKCCLKAKEMGVKVLFTGWGADTHFGGMDKLLSKDWELKDFQKRYEYCPRVNENNEELDKTYNEFINNGNFETLKFLTYNYHIMTLKSFFYIPELFGLIHVPLWGYIGLKDKLDINRIRNGEPKYLIQEVFNNLYKKHNLKVIDKIPFTRPTDIYMNKSFYDLKYIPILEEYIKKNKLTSQQKWMVYCLNRFLIKILRVNI